MLEVTGDKQIRRRSLATGHYRFRRAQLEMDDSVSPVVTLDPYRASGYRNTLLRLELKGRLGRERMEELRGALRELSEHLPWIEVDESGLAELITAADIADEFPEGSFSFRLLNRLLEAQDAGALEAAYDLLVEARR